MKISLQTVLAIISAVAGSVATSVLASKGLKDAALLVASIATAITSVLASQSASNASQSLPAGAYGAAISKDDWSFIKAAAPRVLLFLVVAVLVFLGIEYLFFGRV